MMNTYKAFVTGVALRWRHVTVQAENQEAAEIEAMREFTALVGADCDVEVIDIEQVENES